MKKYNFIYLMFWGLIGLSCENANLEEEVIENQVMTKGSVTEEEFSRYNTVFYNIQPELPIGYDTYRIQGDINTYPQYVEYDFKLWCQIQGELKCVVWASSGEIVDKNGKNPSSIYGVNGQTVEFTLKFKSPITTIHLAFETSDYLNNYYKSGKAKLYFSGARYKGESMGGGGYVDGGYYDLCLYPIYPYNPPVGTTEYHWKCVNCGAINDRHNLTCVNCKQ